mmetsp:Transcript_69874/g.194314  ORF Transcript_69874/g.194314 Transcript_69874/m.194314 type:complete len:178 (-) Transcript_69874:190-723(-)
MGCSSGKSASWQTSVDHAPEVDPPSAPIGRVLLMSGEEVPVEVIDGEQIRGLRERVGAALDVAWFQIKLLRGSATLPDGMRVLLSSQEVARAVTVELQSTEEIQQASKAIADAVEARYNRISHHRFVPRGHPTFDAERGLVNWTWKEKTSLTWCGDTCYAVYDMSTHRVAKLCIKTV